MGENQSVIRARMYFSRLVNEISIAAFSELKKSTSKARFLTNILYYMKPKKDQSTWKVILRTMYVVLPVSMRTIAQFNFS